MADAEAQAGTIIGTSYKSIENVGYFILLDAASGIFYRYKQSVGNIFVACQYRSRGGVL